MKYNDTVGVILLFVLCLASAAVFLWDKIKRRRGTLPSMSDQTAETKPETPTAIAENTPAPIVPAPSAAVVTTGNIAITINVTGNCHPDDAEKMANAVKKAVGILVPNALPR